MIWTRNLRKEMPISASFILISPERALSDRWAAALYDYHTIALLSVCFRRCGCSGGFTGETSLRRDLISFSYRVRSCTESFLHNLLAHRVIVSNEIRDQVWFKGEYATDTTIDSMISALNAFGEVINTCPHLKVDSILEHVYFWFLM